MIRMHCEVGSFARLHKWPRVLSSAFGAGCVAIDCASQDMGKHLWARGAAPAPYAGPSISGVCPWRPHIPAPRFPRCKCPNRRSCHWVRQRSQTSSWHMRRCRLLQAEWSNSVLHGFGSRHGTRHKVQIPCLSQAGRFEVSWLWRAGVLVQTWEYFTVWVRRRHLAWILYYSELRASRTPIHSLGVRHG